MNLLARSCPDPECTRDEPHLKDAAYSTPEVRGLRACADARARFRGLDEIRKQAHPLLRCFFAVFFFLR